MELKGVEMLKDVLKKEFPGHDEKRYDKAATVASAMFMVGMMVDHAEGKGKEKGEDQ